jgi:hypothetical protein
MRLTIFLVLLMWTLDKFINPEHAGQVYEKFYFLGVGQSVIYILGATELIILLAFLVGAFKTLTYGAVLFFHGVSTFSSWQQYLAPYTDYHLLFFAAWPMFAACLALFLLRERDCKLSVG